MKHWTVMLIPHGEGTTRSLNLYALHVWLVIGLFAVLTFSSTFTLQLYRTTRGAMADKLSVQKPEDVHVQHLHRHGDVQGLEVSLGSFL